MIRLALNAYISFRNKKIDAYQAEQSMYKGIRIVLPTEN